MEDSWLFYVIVACLIAGVFGSGPCASDKGTIKTKKQTPVSQPVQPKLDQPRAEEDW